MMLKRTKIVATVGPASGSREKLRALVEAGVDVFRINFSHGDEQQREEFLMNIRSVEDQLDRPVAVCGDLCGPKIRVGMIESGELVLTAGDEIVIQREPIDGTVKRISTTLPELVDVVRRGESVLLDDGRLRFEILHTSPPDEFACRVVVGGPLSSGKGVNLPQTELPISAFTEKDHGDIRWIAERDFDYVALSFVRSGADVVELRKLLEKLGSRAHVIAKVEKPQALDQIDGVIDAADAVMVARGDLGVEMDFPTVPIAQKSIARKCQAAAKPCIIATEMLESMIQSPRPTRAEVSDVANAVFDNADAVMLSAESSIGKYPVDAVTAMQRTVTAAENYTDQFGAAEETAVTEPKTTAALAASIRGIMDVQDIRAVVVYTASGTTARLMAKNRPRCPIIALASDRAVARRCCLYYGVVPRVVDRPKDATQLLSCVGSIAKELQMVSRGDRLIVLAGHPIGVEDSTNGLVVQTVD